MTNERNEALVMLARQEHEREQFILDQIQRLIDEGFDWKLPDAFRTQQSYKGKKGLVIRDQSCEELPNSRWSIILHPKKKLLNVSGNGEESAYPSSKLPMWFYTTVEEKVNETLASLQVAKVPA